MRQLSLLLVAWVFLAPAASARENSADLGMDYAAGLLEGCIRGFLDGRPRSPAEVAKAEEQCACQLPLNRKLAIFGTDTPEALRGVFDACMRLTSYARATPEERERLKLPRKGLEAKFDECHVELSAGMKALGTVSAGVAARASRMSCLCHATAKALFAFEDAAAQGGPTRYSRVAGSSDEMCLQLTQGALGSSESPFAPVLSPPRKREAAGRLGFKGVHLGEKYADVEKLGRFDCKPLSRAENPTTAESWGDYLEGRGQCRSRASENETYANEPVEVRIVFDAKEMVENITISPLVASGGARILKQLERRYGKFDCQGEGGVDAGGKGRRCWYEDGRDAIVAHYPDNLPMFLLIRPRVLKGDVIPRRGRGSAQRDF